MCASTRSDPSGDARLGSATDGSAGAARWRLTAPRSARAVAISAGDTPRAMSSCRQPLPFPLSFAVGSMPIASKSRHPISRCACSLSKLPAATAAEAALAIVSVADVIR